MKAEKIFYSFMALIVIAIIWSFIYCVFIHENGWGKTQKRMMASRNVRSVAYNARFPKVGDRINMDGKEVVIMKQYFWCKLSTFRVRLPNGELTDILKRETIDIKPIKKIPEK